MKRRFGKGSLRSPLAQVKNLGSARDGTTHFIMQRLTAIALVPLLLWFVYCLATFVTADYHTIVTWIKQPFTTVALILLIFVLFYHAHFGLAEVLEDYFHDSIKKTLAMVSMKFLIISITVMSVVDVLRIALGN